MVDSRVSKVVLALFASLITFVSMPVMAADNELAGQMMGHWAAIVALVVFIIGYALVISEETIHLRKSKPMMVAAGVVYLIGVQLPTVAVNVPLNNRLQGVMIDEVSDADAARERQAFESRWNRWNRIRALLAVIATTLLLLSLARL